MRKIIATAFVSLDGSVPQVRPSVGLTWDHCTRPSSAQVSVQKKDANLGHQAHVDATAPVPERVIVRSRHPGSSTYPRS